MDKWSYRNFTFCSKYRSLYFRIVILITMGNDKEIYVSFVTEHKNPLCAESRVLLMGSEGKDYSSLSAHRYVLLFTPVTLLSQRR